ncbi:hypothetical protein DH2020_018214 [Rehmannia glutinosa]|uniref:U-box domain-containing protein n=1 Tax=Rehmannia glutinosa TaxID=99300 RepID=A0ABR0WIA7_REHGL
MKDPVTIVTGITYDRDSIEKWIFSQKNNNCPVTKQVILSDAAADLTPNITLRRLIQSWCTLHAAQGIERLPTPKPPVSKPQILKILKDAKNIPQMQMKCLQRLRSIASQNQTNKASEEALSVLYGLQLSESGLKSLTLNGEFLESLTRFMQYASYESRVYAVMMLKSMLEVADPAQLINLRPEFFVELAQILRDQHCADGRSELTKHGAGLAIVSKKILRISHVASERAVRILHSVSKFSATHGILQEMLQIGVVAKLCLVLQVDCGVKTKERAREILKLHARAWRNSSCIHNNGKKKEQNNAIGRMRSYLVKRRGRPMNDEIEEAGIKRHREWQSGSGLKKRKKI